MKDQSAETVDINNLDEVAPVITSSSTSLREGDKVENSVAGQVIYTATADDTNDISDGVITFSLKDSNGPFSINASTGDVTLEDTNLDFSTQNEYTFTVVATDVANNSSEKNVTVLIDNL